MSKILCTFSGKFGDILWSLPTVRELSVRHSEPVDFGVMPAYQSLVPLLDDQPYIYRARVFPNWTCTGSPHGDQPWQPPAKYEEGYEMFYHLTYRGHPGITATRMPLVDFIASQQGIRLHNPLPFIEAKDMEIFPPPPQPVIPYAFNGDYFDLKQQFLCRLLLKTSGLLAFINVAEMPWMTAAAHIAGSSVYIGCRSACWVLATGLGIRTLTYEPNISRSHFGNFGDVFGCPYGKESPLTGSPQEAADSCAVILLDWRDRYWKREKVDGRRSLAH